MHRFMRGTLGSITIRPRLEICFEDRLQYELERSLNHAVADRRNREDANFPAILRYLLPPSPQRHIVTPDQFALDLLKELLCALRFDGLECHPVNSRSTVILLGQRIRLAQS